jgi:hypothetical protein
MRSRDVSFDNGISRSITQPRSDWMKRRCMGLWCPHLPTAADMGHGIKLWATSPPADLCPERGLRFLLPILG